MVRSISDAAHINNIFYKQILKIVINSDNDDHFDNSNIGNFEVNKNVCSDINTDVPLIFYADSKNENEVVRIDINLDNDIDFLYS